MNKFLVNKSVALLLTTSVLLALKCHNVTSAKRSVLTRYWNAGSWHEQVEVARRLGVSQSVISRLRTPLAQTNSTLDRRRSGRPRSTLQAQDRFLRTSALRSRSVSAEQLRERLSRTGTRASVPTVRNRLHSAGLRARQPYVGVLLSQRHRQGRLALTRQHRRWTYQQWATVLFTDE